MGKGTSQATNSTQQSQQSTTAPWQPTQGILQNILGGIGQQNFNPTSAENNALQTIQTNAAQSPSYGGQATGLANSLMSGGGTDANAGILGDAYKQYQTQLNPIANQNNDPMQNPGMRALLDTIRSDVSNQVNGQFAGAGRDLSGLNQQTLARGISQGEAVPLLNQYNQNVAAQTGAAGNLFNAGGQTAAGLQGFNQQGFQNQATGLDTAMNGIPAAQNAGATNVLNAASQARNLPLQNLAGILGLTLPIAGLGSQNTGTSQGTGFGTNTMSGIQQAQGYANIFGKLFPAGL